MIFVDFRISHLISVKAPNLDATMEAFRAHGQDLILLKAETSRFARTLSLGAKVVPLRRIA
jgi:hypothetical protein